ncbi:energy-converting hydrogenase B subunit P EhbP [Methanobrevibacter ruminantium M1]|uniref:Energy-converting hydrogenase B subunit P EhbP n=1 Tax=Methanobrevibacter ruminantium (strain ATCC 35063 / DSM 1093 / JCM 13430 / OCM 146 / M1) TaxID=634498 RepID=D3E0C5_METRM|nr:energy-converting hydrogenase B subunit P [Methanobrevibacter ruminantium]ADC47849.1 energy-converting hydrogenase B subunit P EhbP [Methanobrevibacter ruminantium M1]
MKFVIRPYHMMSLGGYIVEYDFPYRDIIIVNKTSEHIKFEIPVFDESWIEETRALGLEVIPVRKEDSYLNMYRKAHADLDAFKAKLD